MPSRGHDKRHILPSIRHGNREKGSSVNCEGVSSLLTETPRNTLLTQQKDLLYSVSPPTRLPASAAATLSHRPSVRVILTSAQHPGEIRYLGWFVLSLLHAGDQVRGTQYVSHGRVSSGVMDMGLRWNGISEQGWEAVRRDSAKLHRWCRNFWINRSWGQILCSGSATSKQSNGRLKRSQARG